VRVQRKDLGLVGRQLRGRPLAGGDEKEEKKTVGGGVSDAGQGESGGAWRQLYLERNNDGMRFALDADTRGALRSNGCGGTGSGARVVVAGCNMWRDYRREERKRHCAHLLHGLHRVLNLVNAALRGAR